MTDEEENVNAEEDEEQDTNTGADQDADLSTAEEQANLPGDDESPDYSGNEDAYGSDE